MGIQLPGDVLPGAVGVLETQGGTTQIGESNTTGTVSIALDGAHEAAVDVAVGYGIESKSGGSASSKVVDANVTTRTADTVDVQVELDTAPGAGETTTVYVGITAGSGGD
jgi:hypothetical protein